MQHGQINNTNRRFQGRVIPGNQVDNDSDSESQVKMMREHNKQLIWKGDNY